MKFVLLVLLVSLATLATAGGIVGRMLNRGGGNAVPPISPSPCVGTIDRSRKDPSCPANIAFHEQLKKFSEATGPGLKPLPANVARAIPSQFAEQSDFNIIKMYTAETPVPYYKYINCWLQNPQQPNKPKWIDGRPSNRSFL